MSAKNLLDRLTPYIANKKFRFLLAVLAILFGITLIFTAIFYAVRLAELSISEQAMWQKLRIDKDLSDQLTHDLNANRVAYDKLATILTQVNAHVLAQDSHITAQDNRIAAQDSKLESQDRELDRLHAQASRDQESNLRMQRKLQDMIGDVDVTAISAKKAAMCRRR